MKLLTILLVLAASAFGADVAGKWKAAMEGPDGKMEIEFFFKVDGNKVTGTSTSPMGETQITQGKLDGDNIEFTVEAGDFKVVHKGTVAGQEMKLKVDVGGQSMDLIAKRVGS